jgi:hypothetical protein
MSEQLNEMLEDVGQTEQQATPGFNNVQRLAALEQLKEYFEKRVALVDEEIKISQDYLMTSNELLQSTRVTFKGVENCASDIFHEIMGKGNVYSVVPCTIYRKTSVFCKLRKDFDKEQILGYFKRVKDTRISSLVERTINTNSLRARLKEYLTQDEDESIENIMKHIPKGIAKYVEFTEVNKIVKTK